MNHNGKTNVRPHWIGPNDWDSNPDAIGACFCEPCQLADVGWLTENTVGVHLGFASAREPGDRAFASAGPPLTFFGPSIAYAMRGLRWGLEQPEKAPWAVANLAEYEDPERGSDSGGGGP